MSAEHATLRVGIDVGGTNVDGVLLDPLADANAANRGIIAWHKSPTTTNPSDGIQNVMTALLTKANVDRSRIASVTIGTTHFINAVIEKDQNRLAPVAVIRLSGPFSRDVPPGIDWPTDLRSIICKYSACIDGGLEVDGTIIRDVNEEQVKAVCAEIAQLGIKSVVVNGVFSPSDLVQRQEERAGEWVRKYLPGADVVLSKQVANLGFIERENASILNASILPFARLTIHSFQHALRLLDLTCPVFLTQNDGTILQADMAAQLPIRTFSSGPTNSMCGAAFLVKGGMGAGARDGKEEKENILVVDIGGTTSDCGMLLASGLPRQAAAITEIGGVRMNFSCPDVKSIGLGGGSIVRKPSSPSSPHAKLTIGPDSVGHRIVQSALVFGGNTATATDYAVRAQGLTHIGDPGLLAFSSEFTSTSISPDVKEGKEGKEGSVGEFKKVMKKMLEGLIDRMKTNAEDVTVLLVGGGAVLVPVDEGDGSTGSEEAKLKGASRVVRPEFAGVANAIGAAIARVSGTIDTMVSTVDKSMQTLLDEICALAVDKAVENGAVRESVKIAEMDAIPLQYVANKSRVIVKAIGDFDFSKPTSSLPPLSSSLSSPSSSSSTTSPSPSSATSSSNDVMDKKPLNLSDVAAEKVALDIPAYRPFVNEKREWVVSEVDLEWISVGCYILGTGGGGTPYPHFIRLREMMRKGAVVRVISPEDVKDDDVVACGGGKGSPTVGIEKLPANEMVEAQKLVYDMLGYKPDSVIALEIGGGNGLQGMLLGASNNMNIPTVDGDWMGRAYPVSWQITPVVLGGDQAHFVPTAIADGNGNNMIMTSATSEKMIERAFRAALSEMGSHVACAKGPCSGLNAKSWVVENTISLAWRVGRAVALCKSRNELDNVADVIIDEVGGKESAKVLFKGKIVGVERKVVKGHVYGEVIIAAIESDDEGGASGSASGSGQRFSGTVKVPFKNENILAAHVDASGKETLLACVPDLICVLDTNSGEAIGTPEYRYGLLCTVIGITASERWTSTERGIEIGGPKAFGMDDVEYRPLGTFKRPRSVIDEFGPERV